MAIWKRDNVTLEELNDMRANTLSELLDMHFTEVGENYLKLQMPVDHRTHQPYGLLHGGASAALAETAGSVASWLCIDPEQQICVGMEINCNHVRSKRSGIVVATATALHIGATSHLWDIRITDEAGKLICISRLTVAVLKKKQERGS
jgi:1,4-dihydroxy-2-naphthoyl-CoA hydrolase